MNIIGSEIYFLLAASFPFISRLRRENKSPDYKLIHFFLLQTEKVFWFFGNFRFSYQIHGNEEDTKDRFHQHGFSEKRSVKITVFLPLNYQMEKLCLCHIFSKRRLRMTMPGSLNNKSSQNGTVHYLASNKYISIKRTLEICE